MKVRLSLLLIIATSLFSCKSLEISQGQAVVRNAEWQNKNGKLVKKALVGEPLVLHVDTLNVSDGTPATIIILDRQEKEIAYIKSEVSKNEINETWSYHYNGEELTDYPEFRFEVTLDSCEKTKSSWIKAGMKTDVRIVTSVGQVYHNLKVIRKDTGKKILLKNGYQKDFEIPANLEFFLVFNEYEQIRMGDYIPLDDKQYVYIYMKSGDMANKGMFIPCGQPTIFVTLKKRGGLF